MAIIGSGNIGTDLMIKILRSDSPLQMAAMVGIDPQSDGLARAARMGVPTTSAGIDGLLDMAHFADIRLVFDATSASAHRYNWDKLQPTGVRVLDLTPAAIGPTACRQSISKSISTHLTSTWSPAAAKPPYRSSPPSLRTPWCPTRRSYPRFHRNPPAPAPGPILTNSSKPPRLHYNRWQERNEPKR
ncbi:acetaldehyde dehydrogenase [Mycobacteroides abscessus subsp. bolletii 1513]|uniref:Acetaldehyde dehydrogenase n=1 Tax=Mycobacteroides abscessus subsp. bolletii 1513 TaxID=1299321 RepID=X8DRR1_9MYCO|nr:acetaldehyde dehydrogenase [Mycobacteroides abscessus subsp. bolletii 1513]